MTNLFSFPHLIFFALAAVMITSGVITILSRNTIQSALSLVLAFFAASGLWILLEVEFLGLILVLVYVGAVMTLFLFVIMTINLDEEVLKKSALSYLPIGILIVALFVTLLIYAIVPEHFGGGQALGVVRLPADFSNTAALGTVLYTDYAYAFEIAGVLLLVAIIAAVSLTFRGRQGNKNPTASQQLHVNKNDRIELVKMKAEKY